MPKAVGGIFIGGTGRSGTSILKKIVSLHPAITAVPQESRFIVDPDGLIDLVNQLTLHWTPHTADMAINRFETLMLRHLTKGQREQTLHVALDKLGISPKFRYQIYNLPDILQNPSYDQHVDEFIQKIVFARSGVRWTGAESLRRFTNISGPWDRAELAGIAWDFISKVFEPLIKSEDAKYWCEDTPSNVCRAEDLWGLFPDSKLIHIYRDPRDVMCSYLTKDWAPNKFDEAVTVIGNVMKRWEVAKSKVPEGYYIEIQFEQLVEEKESTLRNLCEFLDVPFDDEMLKIDLQRNANIGRWKSELTEQDAASISRSLANNVDLNSSVLGRYF